MTEAKAAKKLSAKQQRALIEMSLKSLQHDFPKQMAAQHKLVISGVSREILTSIHGSLVSKLAQVACLLPWHEPERMAAEQILNYINGYIDEEEAEQQLAWMIVADAAGWRTVPPSDERVACDSEAKAACFG